MALINTYIIVPTIDMTDDMIAQSLNSSTSMRKNEDSSKSVLKFSGIVYPWSCTGLIKYNHTEILEILAEPEWT